MDVREMADKKESERVAENALAKTTVDGLTAEIEELCKGYESPVTEYSDIRASFPKRHEEVALARTSFYRNRAAGNFVAALAIAKYIQSMVAALRWDEQRIVEIEAQFPDAIASLNAVMEPVEE